jgi:competence protein ComEC
MRFLPLLWFSLAFIAGTVIGGLLSLPVATWLSLAMVGLLTAIALEFLERRRAAESAPGAPIEPAPGWARRAIFGATLAALVCIGAARYQLSVPPHTPFQINWYNDREYDILVTGTVDGPPDVRDAYTNLTVKVQAIDTGDGDLPVGGLLLARVPHDEIYNYGEKVRLRGQPETPPENEEFSYKDYLAFYGVQSFMGQAKVTRLPGSGGNRALAVIYGFRNACLKKVYEIYPDPEASLMAGILLGVDAGIPADLQKAFKDTGTAHIVAISGFNISIIAALFVAIFGRLFGPRRGAIVSIAGITFYTIMVGADPAVVRAAVMASIAIFAALMGRRQVGLNTLVFVAALMALGNPLVLSNVGFQLTFGATLGLILYGEPLQRWAETAFQRRLPQERARQAAAVVSEYFLLTLAAQVTTLPLMAYHFGRISLVSLVANPFILPVQPPLMLGGGIAVLVSFISLSLGKAAGVLTLPFTGYTIRAVEFFAGWPHAVIALGSFSLLFVILYYAALLGWTFAPPPVKARLRPRIAPGLALAALALLAAVAWRSALAAPDGHMHVDFLDVGSGDAILIRTPSGRNVLVNGGPSATKLSDGLGRRLSPTARALDWLIVASTQENEVAALPNTIDRFPPQHVLWSGKSEASPSARSLNEWLADNEVGLNYAYAGQTLDLGDGATLQVLASGPRGAILLLEWKNFRVLLPVGPNFDALAELKEGESIGPVTALLIAESGYGAINPPDWITNLAPQLSILSVAADDKNGLPDSDTLKALEGYSVLRTDRNGWIHLETDGQQMWVEAERGNE